MSKKYTKREENNCNECIEEYTAKKTKKKACSICGEKRTICYPTCYEELEKCYKEECGEKRNTIMIQNRRKNNNND